nr:MULTISPECIES: DUF2127 domain-containing protein [unclassified Arthrobacter]
MTLKGLDGLLEFVGGIFLLLVTPREIGSIVQFLTQHELSEDPGNLIANALKHWADSLTVSASLFGAAYLLLHGLVKIVLVWAVLKDYLWAYPWMIGFLLVFIAFQAYEIFASFSWALVLLTLFDIFVVGLTWHEYGARRAQART